MQIGKYWIGLITIICATFLTACYDDNGNSTTSGTTPPASTNNLAPTTLAGRRFTLQYSSGFLQGVDVLDISADGSTFTRTPQTVTAALSSGNFVGAALQSGGNVWTASLNTTLTNNVAPTNAVAVQTLTLTFTSTSGGAFTLLSPDNGSTSSGTFNMPLNTASDSSKRQSPFFAKTISPALLWTLVSSPMSFKFSGMSGRFLMKSDHQYHLHGYPPGLLTHST